MIIRQGPLKNDRMFLNENGGVLLPQKILYADDDENYRRLVKIFLEKESYRVVTANDGLQVIDLLCVQKDIDLVILDVMMPELDGWETCREIRKAWDIPILMLTALDDINSEVFGIENGADDYVAKPFSHEILMARVKALLRRTRRSKLKKIADEGMELDETKNSVHINDSVICLTPKEFELLKFLVFNKGLVLYREKILDNVWGYDYFGDPRTVDTHIKSLRSKLGKEGTRIITVRNKGYSYRGEIK